MIAQDEVKQYVVVFYDVDKPLTWREAQHKRIDLKQAENLLDESVPDKQVILRNSEGESASYKIVSRRTFYIVNSVDNCLFIICDVKKIKA